MSNVKKHDAMIKKTIYIGNEAHIHLRDQQMVIKKPEEEKTVPVEDIGILVIDHYRTSVSHGIMEALIENNAAVLFCNSKHIPHGLVLPMQGNNTFTENMRFQLDASEPLKKNLWKQTIQAKIGNQAALLQKLGREDARLQYLVKQVQSGDPQNVEGRAAAYYWKILFDDLEVFTRGRYELPPNNMLNYGYAILRAVIARSLVASGMLPAMGIHHRNKYNAFCLADDIMEPYRPFVDELVQNICKEPKFDFPENLTKDLKAKLLQVPVLDVEIDGMKSPLMVAAQRTTASLMRCFLGENRKLLYPVLH